MCFFFIASCSKDDDEQPLEYQIRTEGDVNGEKVSINESYEAGTSKSSKFRFVIDSDQVTEYFQWTIKLKDTPDTTMTLYLRINNVSKASGTIFISPNLDPDTFLLNPKNLCYVIVRNVKTDSVERFYNTKSINTSANWKFYMVRKVQKTEKKYGNTREYLNLTGDYPGIEGMLYGTLVSQRDRNKKMNLNLKFTIF